MVEFMNPVQWRRARRTMIGGVLIAGAVLVGGCSGTLEDVWPDRQPSYKSSRGAPPLEVPPDLTSSTVQDTLPIPGIDATYSQYASGTAGAEARDRVGGAPDGRRRHDRAKWRTALAGGRGEAGGGLAQAA